MAAITISGPDHALFSMPGNPVGVQALTYSTASQAQAAFNQFETTEGEVFNLPMPNGQMKPLTRGDILVFKLLANSILIGLRAATGIPWPLIP